MARGGGSKCFNTPHKLDQITPLERLELIIIFTNPGMSVEFHISG